MIYSMLCFLAKFFIILSLQKPLSALFMEDVLDHISTSPTFVDPELSISKLVTASKMQDVSSYALDLMDMGGYVLDEKNPVLNNVFQKGLLFSTAMRIAGGTDEVFVENQMIVSSDYELSAGKSASSVGPITINSGVTVTIPSGQNWIVL